MEIFDEEEIEYCCKFKDPYPHFAGKFALKESFQKAARKHIAISDIHTKHGSVGEPIINCHSLKYKKIDASVSHEKNYAIAIVMIFW